MTSVREAASPPRILYRIGRLPNPLAWPAKGFTGAGRFDDPRGQFSTLYATEQRRGCFIGSLARFRASPRVLTELKRVVGAPGSVLMPAIPTDWCAKRGIARFYLRPGQRWLDLRVLETREALRAELAEVLLNLGLADLDCWAIFQSAAIEPVGSIEPVSPDDPDFRETMRLFGLTV